MKTILPPSLKTCDGVEHCTGERPYHTDHEKCRSYLDNSPLIHQYHMELMREVLGADVRPVSDTGTSQQSAHFENPYTDEAFVIMTCRSKRQAKMVAEVMSAVNFHFPPHWTFKETRHA